jgi:hypothetical protein
MDYTIRKYDQLCQEIKKAGYNSLTMSEFFRNIQSFQLDCRKIVIRHDVDRQPANALRMAEIESQHDIKASYYFRVPHTLNKEIIRAIYCFGHEVSLHYECVDKAKGDFEKAAQIMQDELKLFEEIATPLTVSMHGNPSTKFDNRDMWKHAALEDFGLIGEVYLTMDFEKVLYYSDTGRTWEDGKHNIKDIIPENMKSVSDKPVLRTTDDLISLIKCEKRNLYLLIHPERWSSSYPAWINAFVRDTVFNFGKLCFKFLVRILR